MREHQPHSLEGVVAQEVLMQGEAWKYAGMAAVLTGIDLDAALARVDARGADMMCVRRLVALGEPGLLTGMARAREQAKARED